MYLNLISNMETKYLAFRPRFSTRISAFFMCLTMLSFLLGCRKEDSRPEAADLRTLLIYMAGDNTLSEETNEKIESLRKGYMKRMGRLLIYQDAYGQLPKLVEINGTDNGAALITLKNYPSENSADPTVFKKVLDDVRKFAPASSYGLIMFSHASGWLPANTLVRPSSVAQDGRNYLEIRDFVTVLPDHFFDFIIFEACFMSGIEVLFELRNKTDYIVSSSAEILSPGFTPLYSKFLPALYQKEADLMKVGQGYFDYYNGMTGDYRSATISVISTKGLNNLYDWTKVSATKELESQALTSVQHYDRYADYRLFFDFKDYYQRISAEKTHAEFSRLIDEVVIYKAATPDFMINYSGFKIKNFSGLTTYIPQKKFPFLNEEYQKLSWSHPRK